MSVGENYFTRTHKYFQNVFTSLVINLIINDSSIYPIKAQIIILIGTQILTYNFLGKGLYHLLTKPKKYVQSVYLSSMRRFKNPSQYITSHGGRLVYY